MPGGGHGAKPSVYEQSALAAELLSDYEKVRQPHKPPEGGAGEAVVVLEYNALLPEMKCPICLSIITQASAPQECLHRFCTPCITKSLAMKKECPTCRVKVKTQRSLRKDPQFDKLVSVCYPDKDAFERRQQEIFRKVRENSNQDAMLESFDKGIKSQQHARRQKQLSIPRAIGWEEARKLERSRASQLIGGQQGKRARHDAGDDGYGGAMSHIELLMEPHPADGAAGVALTRKFLEVPSDCTFGHLKHFLEKQLPKEDQGPPKSDVANYNLSVCVTGQGYVYQLDYSKPVATIYRELPEADQMRRLVVYYSRPPAQLG